MISVTLRSETDYSEWRAAARRLLQHGVPPEQTDWRGPREMTSFLDDLQKPWGSLSDTNTNTVVPRAFPELAERVLCHTDPERFAKLYRILFRLQSDPLFLNDSPHDDILWLHECDHAIRRDRHKMHAFVRFKKVGEGRFKREQFAAWFEPTHYITRLTAPFFTRRFPNMDWVIITPHCSARWNGQILTFDAGGKKSDVPTDDALEEHWKTYFQSIFNPARLKVGAMLSEMPKKYWKNMPETALIPDLVASAKVRQNTMETHGVTAPNPLASRLRSNQYPPPQIPDTFEDLSEISDVLTLCKNCDLYKSASQPVMGEGPDMSRLLIVGEQPGDKEDIVGRPFVGPAGQLLNDCLKQAGLIRSEIYLTNAVKHFKFVPKRTARIHSTPGSVEIKACNMWLQKEIALVKPEVIIALGATAAQAILGKAVTLEKIRGCPLPTKYGPTIFVTYHPSYMLRLPNTNQAMEIQKTFIEDLCQAALYQKPEK